MNDVVVPISLMCPADILKDARHLASSARAAVEANLEEARKSAPTPSSSIATAAIDNQSGSSSEPVTGGRSGGNKEQEPVTSADRAEEDRPEKEGKGRAVLNDDGDASGDQRKTSSVLNNGGGAASADAFVPLHGLLFLLGELHMKTPEEILDKVVVELREMLSQMRTFVLLCTAVCTFEVVNGCQACARYSSSR